VIGGWAMHPLLLCSLGVVGISVLLVRIMNRNTLMPPLVVASVKEAARTGDVEKVAELAGASDSLFTTSLASGLRQYNGRIRRAARTRWRKPSPRPWGVRSPSSPSG
jgi:hypothetical protein